MAQKSVELFLDVGTVKFDQIFEMCAVHTSRKLSVFAEMYDEDGKIFF